MGNHDHLWDQGSLASSAGGCHVAQRAEERGAAWQRSHEQFYPGSGPLDGGKTLRPAFDCIHMGCSTEYMYLPRDDSNEYEIVY